MECLIIFACDPSKYILLPAARCLSERGIPNLQSVREASSNNSSSAMGKDVKPQGSSKSRQPLSVKGELRRADS